MSPSLSPAASRALALAVLLALVGLAYLGVVAPLLDDYAQTRAQIAETSAALDHAQRTSGRLAELQAELARLKAQQGAAVGFLRSSNPSLAAAELQNRIKSSVEAAHGELRSTQTLATREENGFRRVSVRGQIAVNLAALQRVFYDLEAASPFLFLDNIEIHTRAPQRHDSGGAGEDPMLEVRFDVYGYMPRAAS